MTCQFVPTLLLSGTMKDLVFKVTQEEDGLFCAECLSEPIFSQGDTWEQLRSNINEAVRGFFFDNPHATEGMRLRLVREATHFSSSWSDLLPTREIEQERLDIIDGKNT